MLYLLFGVVQGLTEFLPISSSAHLYILKRLFSIRGDLLAFFVFLHFATILAIVIFLRNELRSILKQGRVLLHIVLITLITGAIGLAIKFTLSKFFDYKYLVSGCLLVNALLLLRFKKNQGGRNYADIQIRDSIIVGIMQGIAVLPGISRSGITILSLLRRGFHIKDAFSLSFLIAIPAIIGASMVEYGEILNSTIGLPQLAIAFVAAFSSGMLALKIVKYTLLNERFKMFSYYCLLIALVSAVL